MAWIELENEPSLEGEEQNPLMDEQEFENQIALAAEGRWDELGLDTLPEDWAPSSVEELREDA